MSRDDGDQNDDDDAGKKVVWLFVLEGKSSFSHLAPLWDNIIII